MVPPEHHEAWCHHPNHWRCTSLSSSHSLPTSSRTPCSYLSLSSSDRRRLTSRIVDLTRRRQLAQIMEEVEAAKRRARGGRGGGINTIVMNAVLEACVSCGDVDLAVRLFEGMHAPRGCGVDGVSYGILLKVALKVETLSGFTNSPLRTHLFLQIILNDPDGKYMILFQETQPLCSADLILENVAMRFFKDSAVPLVNDWGSCIGIVHSHDCTMMDAPLLSMARPPLCVPTSTSLERVIDLLREKSKMVIVVKTGDMFEGRWEFSPSLSCGSSPPTRQTSTTSASPG